MKKYLLYALTGVLLTACGKEETIGPDGPQTPGEGEIRFEIGIAPQSGVEAGPQTRVVTDEQFKCTWEAGDAIGIFAFAEGTDVTSEDYYINNVKLTYDGTSWTSATPLYWPKDGKKLRFYACYPYNAMDGVKGFDFHVKMDQRADTDKKSNLDLSDLMMGSSIWLPSGSPVELRFSHYACMVELKLDNTVGAIDPNEEVIVKMRDVATKASFTFQSSGWTAMSGTDKADITMRRVEQPGDADYRTSYTFRAIVPLQEQEDEMSLFHIANGDLRLNSSKQTLETKIGRAELFTQKLPVYIHKVYIHAEHEFYLGRYEVTCKQYAAFLNAMRIGKANRGEEVKAEMGSGQQTLFKVSGWDWTPKWNDATGRWEAENDYPMTYVTWYGAMAFAQWAGGRLPEDQEWINACRAGTGTTYSFGNDASALGDYAVYYGNKEHDGPSLIGTKKPNPWGLYNMHGNVSEWTTEKGKIRGGAWKSLASECGSHFDFGTFPDYYNHVGFRMAFNRY